MKIGRNDPCPCGSGKKYKNCCLRKETMSIPDRIKQAVKERDIMRISGMCLQICIGTWRESNGGVPATLHVLRYTFACLSSDTNLSYV